jgi:hypothetical protein
VNLYVNSPLVLMTRDNFRYRKIANQLVSMWLLVTDTYPLLPAFILDILPNVRALWGPTKPYLKVINHEQGNYKFVETLENRLY